MVNSCVVRSQAQCLLSWVGISMPEARAEAGRREMVGRLERQLKKEGRSLPEGQAGPGAGGAMLCEQ